MNNKNIEIKNIVKNSMEPVDDGGRKYNFIYVILGIIGGVLGIATGVVTIVLTVPLGLGVGWLIKNKILDIKAYSFRNYTFKCDNKLPFSDLMNNIIPELTKMNMRVELNSDGSPMILHNKIIYDFKYNEDMTFSIWWRKTIGGAFIVFDSIKMYRNISVDMGIISYVIQKATNLTQGSNSDGILSRDVPSNNRGYQAVPPNYNGTYETVNDNPIQQAQSEAYKFCHNCGTKYQVGTKFCQNCGAKLG